MKNFKRFIGLFIITVLFISACSSKPAIPVENSSSVEKFVSEDGKFAINFPAEPDVSQESVPTDVGEVQMYIFLYEESVTKAFMVTYSDFPSELVAGTDAKGLLVSSKEGQLQTLINPIIDEESDIDINGNPGVYFKANDGSFYLVAKIFLVGNRLYQLLIMRDGSYPSEEETKSFIDSFELRK